MVKRKRYRLKKRVKNFLIFYTIICILFVASYTLSRYVQVVEGTGGIDIAKFKVTVNNINVKDGTPIQFNFSETSSFVSKKIAPNSTGYFEFLINPAETEVSLEYELKFRVDEIDDDFKLTYYTINDGETHYDLIDGNMIQNDYLLPKTDHGFTEENQLSIKVYWSWDEQEDITNPDISIYENKAIHVIAIVKQKINEEV